VIRETMYNRRLAVAFNVSLHAKTELSALIIETILQTRELNPRDFPFDKCVCAGDAQ